MGCSHLPGIIGLIIGAIIVLLLWVRVGPSAPGYRAGVSAELGGARRRMPCSWRLDQSQENHRADAQS